MAEMGPLCQWSCNLELLGLDIVLHVVKVFPKATSTMSPRLHSQGSLQLLGQGHVPDRALQYQV